MKTNEKKFPGMSIGDHSANLNNGFIAGYKGEGKSLTETDPKTRTMTLNAKKLTGLVRFSSELLEDLPNGGEKRIIEILGKGLGWYRDKAFLKGGGNGSPLGVFNSPCVIEVEKQVGQGSETIVYENLVQMVGRLHPACFNNAIFVCHVSVIPQLLSLCMPVGTGGSVYPVLSESNGEWRILTRPVVFTEKTYPLGTCGDILLADFSQYLVGLRSGMRFDKSIHVHFESDEVMGRLIERHDGQALWDEVLTLEDGSTTVSPFVVLGDRA